MFNSSKRGDSETSIYAIESETMTEKSLNKKIVHIVRSSYSHEWRQQKATFEIYLIIYSCRTHKNYHCSHYLLYRSWILQSRIYLLQSVLSTSCSSGNHLVSPTYVLGNTNIKPPSSKILIALENSIEFEFCASNPIIDYHDTANQSHRY